jgi:Flp pilus assembly protein TadB
MECKFCHREFEDGLSECPYCHCMVEIEPQKMSQVEKNTFEGVTIDVADGTVHEGPNIAEDSSYEQERKSQETEGPEQPESGFHVYHWGSGLLWTGLILLAILAVIFFLLPTFLLFGVALAAVYFVARLFF